MKPLVVISCPADTFSGYGARSRDIALPLIKSGKYDVKILPQRWGQTPKGFIQNNPEWGFLSKHILNVQPPNQPEIWMQITVPNEFQPIGKFNIGCTAGIESNICPGDWIEGLNRMNLNFVSSNHSKKVFEDNNVIVFMDIYPINDGHILVVPKKHYVSINDMTDQEYINYQLSFKKIYDKFTNNFGADGFTIVQNFGLDFDSLNIEDFEKFVSIVQSKHKDQTTNGMFAPWVIYKSDFERIGGHDWGFAPFPYEDSDIFQRWILAGYELVQSRDAFVYHLTCRGHRWTGEIGKNDDYFTQAEQKARQYYIKKWGSWIKNDEYQCPILMPVYKKCAIIQDYKPSPVDDWFSEINPQDPSSFDVVVELNTNTFAEEEYHVVINLNQIVQETNEIGKFQVGNLTITINSLADRSKELIFINNND